MGEKKKTKSEGNGDSSLYISRPVIVDSHILGVIFPIWNEVAIHENGDSCQKTRSWTSFHLDSSASQRHNSAGGL